VNATALVVLFLNMDIPTLFIVNIALGFTLALCVLVVAIGRNKQLYPWAIAFGIHGLSYILISLRGQIPDLFSIILANLLISSMLAIFTEGIYRLGERHPPRLLIWWPAALTVISFWFLIDDFESRVIIGAAFSVYQTGFLMWSIAQDFHEKSGQGKWIIVIAATISTAMFVFRAGVVVMGDNLLLAINSSSPMQSITFIGSMIGLIMFAIGLLVAYMERAEQAVLSLALFDPLTQLGNRRVLEKELNHAMSRGKEKQISALIMLDLDHFKTLNDTYGHAIGDQLLIEVAYRVKESVKAEDTVVRLGGDEFVVLVADLGIDLTGVRTKAATVANRILQQVAEPYHLMVQLESKPLSTLRYECTCSIGVSLFQGDATSREIVMERADVAMYKAKQLGRNQVVFAEGEASS
jgi:diguanylate cyclase (GGDEF)-like protein